MILGIVQARMGSTRLPGKVLAPVCGRPLLWHLMNRLRVVPTIERLVVATSVEPADDQIAEFCLSSGLECFRGQEQDVLDRFFQAAKYHAADVVVRITADCPLIDPEIVDRVVGLQIKGLWDYTSNTIERTFPDGLDVEAFTFEALQRAWHQATLMSEREHVTPYIWKHRELFSIYQYTQSANFADMRWTVDEPEDLEFVSRVFEYFDDGGRLFLMDDVLELIDKQPQLSAINSHFGLNEGYQKSLREDRVVTRPQGATAGGAYDG